MLNYIRGYYTIVIEGLGIERFISNLRKNNISVYNIKKTNKNTIEFRVYKSDIKVLKEIFREGNFEIKIKQKTGIPFLFKRIYKMKITWICALISVFLLLSTSQFVTDIYIQTPEGIKVEELRKEIYKAGLKPGVYKKNVDRKEIRDYIMSKFSEVAYVSINVKGTNIFITVTKKDESLNSKQNSNYCNIIASKNGIIEKVVAKSGKAVV
ncbi:MAG: sporulation protein YqfD, partial [Clostridioides sp.]|nr:sporulation protein YqfD [Clostridioides sp.]